jgi:transposase
LYPPLAPERCFMSLPQDPIDAVPEETARVAYAAFPKGNIYMKMRDTLGTIYANADFADLFPRRGQPAEAPWRLALVTIMQFAESLTDRQAADAVRSRIDWKYALGLALSDPGFDFSVLSKFRTRLVQHQATNRLFDTMLTLFTEQGWVSAGRRQRTDSTHILGAIRSLNRLELVGETLRQALETLAHAAPPFLTGRLPTQWVERYGQPLNDQRLPKEEGDQPLFAQLMGTDGRTLLQWIYDDPQWQGLHVLPAVETLRQVWIQQFYEAEDQVHWRTDEQTPPPTFRIVSPFDRHARQARKRDTRWLGYKVHLTETCEADQPLVITHVETRPAPQQDVLATEFIHRQLQNKKLLPSTHIVDTAYVSGPLLVQSQKTFGVELLGPVLPDTSWQAEANQGFDLPHFHIDWTRETATCPQGQKNRYWRYKRDPHGHPVIRIFFPPQVCNACPVRACCTRSKTTGRTLSLQPQAAHERVQATRKRQARPEFKDQYHVRAGVEGTISQAAVALHMRRTRYRGPAKVHFQHLATAAAMNLKRVFDWLEQKPRAATRTSPLAALAA